MVIFYKYRNLLFYNLIFLGALFLFLTSRSILEGTYVNWIYWPGAYLGTLAILTSVIINRTTNNKSIFRNTAAGQIFNSAVFGVLILLLSDLLIMILERFFRLEEHYTFLDLALRWTDQWYLVFEGIFIYIIYQIAIRYDMQRKYIGRNRKMIADLEQDVTSSNLELLRLELNPHFLYNAMNSISMMIRVRENSKAIEMVAHLNELLRIAFRKSGDQIVTLSEELTLLNTYLKIEMVRFGERIEVNQMIDEKTLGAYIPQLILQPIVENAFKHGMSEDLGKQLLLIKSEKRNNFLVMSVFNTTQSNLQPDHLIKNNHGIGLQNVVQRLTRIYGNTFKFQAKQHSDGIEFLIMIPFKTS